MYNSDGPLAEKLKKGYIMRKYVGKFLVGILALVMAFSLVACSSKYKTMEDYVQSSEVQEQIASVKEQVESAGMQIELKGEGDKLIYCLLYTSRRRPRTPCTSKGIFVRRTAFFPG